MVEWRGEEDEAGHDRHTPWGKSERRKGMTRGEDLDFRRMELELQLLGVAAFRLSVNNLISTKALSGVN